MKSWQTCIAIVFALAPATALAQHHSHYWQSSWGSFPYYGPVYMNGWGVPTYAAYPPAYFVRQPVTPLPDVQPTMEEMAAANEEVYTTPAPIPPSTYFLITKVVSCKQELPGSLACRNIDLDPASIPEDRVLLVRVATQYDLTQGYQVTVEFVFDGSKTAALIRAVPLVEGQRDKQALLGTGITSADALRSLLSSNP
jgi:hypothetical protein